tara:strand:- start:5479 stop:6033 length:555 start_codon:yes stop_codon:yes gene_type:complete
MDNMSLIIVVVVVLLVVVLMYNNGSRNNSTESFVDTPSPNNESEVGSGFEIEEGFEVKEVNEVNEPFENPKPVEEGFEDESTPVNNANQLPAECYPKDVLGSADLLPAGNTLHNEAVPSGQGALGDKNFLTAGYHVGVNTVGQSLRNANRQLRSDPPNPQVKVSPWNQTTIETDINRKPLEIGS